MTLNEFLETIRAEEISLYEDEVDKYHALNSRRPEFEPKNNSDEEYTKWDEFIKNLQDISADYDVHDYSRTILYKGEEEYKYKLIKAIDNHISKLEKDIKKTVGNVNSIEETSSNIFKVQGDKASCDIIKSPIKVSSTKSIVKTRLKFSNIIEKPIEQEIHEDNEYIKQWKAEELKGFLKSNEMFWNDYSDAYNDLSSLKDEYRKAVNSEKSKEDLRDLKEKINNADSKVIRIRDKNSFFYNYGHSSDFEDRCKKIIDKHFQELQAKVENKIGQIVEIYPTGSNGYDYHFEGVLGSCDVEVILAGGYNIQRLHTRWIVKNLNKIKESLTIDNVLKKLIENTNLENVNIEKQTNIAKKRFIELCNTTGREHIPQEEPIDNWTLRDFVSEAQYQYEMRKDEWDRDIVNEGKRWKRFVNRFVPYLDNDIKCTQEHISHYDLI